jgi:hypothetical protein
VSATGLLSQSGQLAIVLAGEQGDVSIRHRKTVGVPPSIDVELRRYCVSTDIALERVKNLLSNTLVIPGMRRITKAKRLRHNW